MPLSTHTAKIHTIENNIQSDFNDSKQWSKNNKMHVHDTKTSCKAVGTRLDGFHHLNIKSGDVGIKHVSNQKLLGIYINENLNWTTHIKYLCKVVSSKISLLRQLSEYVRKHVQKQFYQSYIHHFGINGFCQSR